MTDHPIKFKPSKHADFMQAAKVHTPKYKFYVEVGGDPTHPAIVLIMGLGAQSLVWPQWILLCVNQCWLSGGAIWQSRHWQI